MGINVCEFELQVNSFFCCALAMKESNGITVSVQLVTLVKMTVPSTFRSVIPVVYLRTKQTNTCRKSSQKQNYKCNIQGVSVYTPDQTMQEPRASQDPH